MGDWQLRAGTIDIVELAPLPLTMVRLGQRSSDATALLERLLGIELPVASNAALGKFPRAIWLGPNEWLVIGVGLETVQQPGSNRATILAVEVSDGHYGLSVSGAQARDLLAKGCSIDLHPRSFAVNCTARTLFAQVPVVIDHIDDDLFRLWFDVSYRNYVRAWFADALIELS